MKANDCNIGCSSFYNYKWKTVFYPDDVPSKNWFLYYSQHFNCFEINGTFYKFPTLKVMQNWYKRSPENYLFSVKAPKVITHIKKLKDCQEEIDTFYSVSKEGLKEKLACFLFQFPPSFDYSEERLNAIIKNLDSKFKNVVEFRHESWFDIKIIQKIQASNITFCTISHPKLPEIIVENKFVYVRLHGNTRLFYSSYSLQYLKNLKKKLGEFEIKTSFVFFNNTASEAGILNALELKKVMEF